MDQLIRCLVKLEQENLVRRHNTQAFLRNRRANPNYRQYQLACIQREKERVERERKREEERKKREEERRRQQEKKLLEQERQERPGSTPSEKTFEKISSQVSLVR